MPRAKHLDTLARQWELLKTLPPRRPGRTAKELRDSLEADAGQKVTKRTVERDLVDLSRLFPIVCNDRSKPYGWHWMPGAYLKIPGMDLAEALSLGLLEDLLRQLVPPSFYEALEGRFGQARGKLDALPKHRFSRWTDLVRYLPPGMPFRSPAISPEVLGAIQESLMNRRMLRISHRRTDTGESKEHLLHPLALIQQGVRSYLVACDSRHDNPILYAIHRIHEAEVLEKPVRRPKGFSLDKFLERGGAQFGNGNPIKLRARVAKDLADILRETPISDDQKLTDRAGEIILTATVTDSWQLEFWILSSGPNITILKPVPLRKKISSRLDQALGQYRPGTKSP